MPPKVEATRLTTERKGTVVLIQKTNEWAVNAGKWFLGRIMKRAFCHPPGVRNSRIAKIGH